MTGMFQECKELEYLDLSNFDTSKVTSMNKMFMKCHKLKQIKGINNFNFSIFVDKEEMFEECNELAYLQLSKFKHSDNSIKDEMKKKTEELKNLLNEKAKHNLQLKNDTIIINCNNNNSNYFQVKTTEESNCCLFLFV